MYHDDSTLRFTKSEKLQNQIWRQTQKHTLRLALFGLLIVDRMHGLNSLDQSKIELKQYILIWHYNQLKIPLSTEMIEDFVDKFGCTYNYPILWYFCVMDFKFTLALSLAPSVFFKKYNLSISGIRLYIVIEYAPGIHPMRDLPD